MTFKQSIYTLCYSRIAARIASLQATLADLRQSAANETKSTAGDKHETALAMLQIEQENTGRQLQEVLLQKAVLNKIDPLIHTRQAVVGSLLTTNHGLFFLSVALGKITCDGKQVTALSAQSPLGTKMLGARAGDTFELNGKHYTVESVE